MAVSRHAGASLLVVPNASPYERGKDDVRLDLVQRRAREAGAALAYCNLVGGQDELVFDGDSILVSASGELLARGPQFEEALIVADLELPSAGAGPGPETVADERDIQPAAGGTLPRSSGAGEAVDAGDGSLITIERVALPAVPLPARHFGVGGAPGPSATRPPTASAGPFWPRLDDLAEVYAALVLGTADYVRKNGFRSVLLALSGGIDSALVATIAADAIGPENVHVILMPSKWSSDHSVTDAEDLVERQGLQRADHRRSRRSWTRSATGSATSPLSGLPAENLQSRVRGVINMAVSNDEGHLVLTTGNKSEIATGYSTLYGDSAGGFGPIKDVLKTLVWDAVAVAERGRPGGGARLRRSRPNSIDKPPSAELAPGQLDTDSLPDYAVLDALLDDYVEKDMGSAELIAAGPRPGARRAGDPARRPGRVQAAAVPARTEDQPEELRPRPAAADHQPLAGGAAGLAAAAVTRPGSAAADPGPGSLPGIDRQQVELPRPAGRRTAPGRPARRRRG